MLILGDFDLTKTWAELFSPHFSVTLLSEFNLDFHPEYRLIENLDSLLEEEETFDIIFDLHHDSALKAADLMDYAELIVPETLVFTNTTSITATAISALLLDHVWVIGVSIYSGIADKNAVEICKALQSDRKALNEAERIFKLIGKKVFTVSDSVGLISLRTVSCLVNEAAFALQENVASAEDIDQSMLLGTNYPKGPLKWADHIGLDVVLNCLDGLFDEFHDDRYRSAVLLRQMVRASNLGIKTGKGFYNYHL